MKNKLMIGTVLTGVLFLSGCGVVSSSLNANNLKKLNKKTVTIIQKDTLIKPGLSGTTGSYIDLNLIVAIAQNAENRKTTGPVYARPTQEISRRTMSLLSKKFGMKKLPYTGEKDLKSDYVLKVQTNWWFDQIKTTFLTTPGSLMMANDIQLIDLKNNKVIAHSVCMYGDDAEERMKPASTKEIFERKGLIIKREARKAIESCMKKIDTQIFEKPSKAKPIKDPDIMHRPLI